MSRISLRKEQPGDESAIREITRQAFRGMPYAGGDEQDVIDRLRAGSALSLSLVAVEDDTLLGQVTFSPAKEDGGSSPWFALGPVSVRPARQGEGIGAMLINEGLDRIRALGGRGCILTGNPAYYSRFGFTLSPGNCPEAEPAEFFQLLVFDGDPPVGRFDFHPGFYGDL